MPFSCLTRLRRCSSPTHSRMISRNLLSWSRPVGILHSPSAQRPLSCPEGVIKVDVAMLQPVLFSWAVPQGLDRRSSLPKRHPGHRHTCTHTCSSRALLSFSAAPKDPTSQRREDREGRVSTEGREQSPGTVACQKRG